MLNSNLQVDTLKPDFSAGWETNANTYIVVVRSNYNVTITGSLKKSDASTGSIVYTLPKGYRPAGAYTIRASAIKNVSVQQNVAMVSISANGDIALTTGTGGILSDTEIYRFSASYICIRD